MNNPFFLACASGNVEHIKHIIGLEKVNINDLVEIRETPLNISILLNQIESCKLLLEHKADPNCINGLYTPLITAARAGYDKICELLLKNGANVNYCGDDVEENFTALHYCAQYCTQYNYIETCKILIKYGANVNYKSSHGTTPIFNIINSINLEEKPEKVKIIIQFIKLLLDNGANINHKDNSGATPLYLACCCGSKKIIQFLLDNGANTSLDSLRKLWK